MALELQACRVVSAAFRATFYLTAQSGSSNENTSILCGLLYPTLRRFHGTITWLASAQLRSS